MCACFLVCAQECLVQVDNILKLPDCDTISIFWRSQSGCTADSVGSVKVCSVQNTCITYPVPQFSLNLSQSECENGCVVQWKESLNSHSYKCILTDYSIITPNFTQVCNDSTCIPYIGKLRVYQNDSNTVFPVKLQSTTELCPFLRNSRKNGKYRSSIDIEAINYCYTCPLDVSNGPITILAYVESANLSNITQFSLASCDTTFLPTSTTRVTGNLK